MSTDEGGAAMKTMTRLLLPCAAMLLAAGCVVQETRPQPQLQATQATSEIPAEQLLDVGIYVFDPGIPREVQDNPELADKTRIYPEIRKAEARYIPMQARNTLEGTSQWGAVRVIPASVDPMDVMVHGRILESNGAHLRIDVTVTDSTGRTWFNKRYEGDADTRAYRDGAPRGRDPFQNVYVNLADDLLAARQKLAVEDLRNIRRVTELRFAQGFAPDAFKGYLAKDSKTGQYRVARLPADGDPVRQRVDAIRERDANVVDTVSDSYAAFSERVNEPYTGWRKTTYDEIIQEEQLKAQARNRMILGAAAIAAAVFVPDNCSGENCARIADAARYGAMAGGTLGIMSGLKKRDEAKIHTEALKEISGSFQTQAEPLVVDVEGRTLKLTGTAEEQYAEWRRLLQELYKEETGGVASQPAPSGNATKS